MKTKHFEIEKAKKELVESPEILDTFKLMNPSLDLKKMDASLVKKIEKVKKVRDAIFDNGFF